MILFIKCKIIFIANQPKHHLIITRIATMKQSYIIQYRVHFMYIPSNHLF